MMFVNLKFIMYHDVWIFLDVGSRHSNQGPAVVCIYIFCCFEFGVCWTDANIYTFCHNELQLASPKYD